MAEVLDRTIIEESLIAVSEKCADPTPDVYRLLFQKHPEVEALFILDTNNSVKGHMQFQAVECILDLLETGHFAATLLQSERVNHDGLGIPVETFRNYFPTLKEAYSNILGEGWSADYEAAWTHLLARIDEIILSA